MSRRKATRIIAAPMTPNCLPHSARVQARGSSFRSLALIRMNAPSMNAFWTRILASSVFQTAMSSGRSRSKNTWRTIVEAKKPTKASRANRVSCVMTGLGK